MLGYTLLYILCMKMQEFIEEKLSIKGRKFLTSFFHGSSREIKRLTCIDQLSERATMPCAAGVVYATQGYYPYFFGPIPFFSLNANLYPLNIPLLTLKMPFLVTLVR